MGDLFGGPFLCPCSTCLQGHYGGRVMTALMIPAAPPLGSWRCHLFPQFGGAAKGKRL